MTTERDRTQFLPRIRWYHRAPPPPTVFHRQHQWDRVACVCLSKLALYPPLLCSLPSSFLGSLLPPRFLVPSARTKWVPVRQSGLVSFDQRGSRALMKVEGSGGAVPVKWRRQRDAAGSQSKNKCGGVGVSVRRRTRWRVQADATPRTPLQRLLAACRVAFGGPGTVPAPADVSLVRGILDKIGPEDVLEFLEANTDTSRPQHMHPIITRTTVYSCRNFSIVIFFLPPTAVIPLHNHPGMTVFSKLLLGSLHIKSYDWIDPDDHLTGGGSTNVGAVTVRLARLVLDADLSAPCDALVLYPESGGNMHQFAAATPCAVLDVLGPPYSKHRDCTYYQDLPYSNHDDPNENETGDVDAATDEMKRKARLAWLKETDKPEDLKMYELPYQGSPIF